MSEIDPTLTELVSIQTAFDVDNFSGADTPEGKRRHIFLHLGKLLGKFATVEEQADHGEVDALILGEEVIPDLLVYAAQLAELEDVNLAAAYHARLLYVADRNGTGVVSVDEAFGVVQE